MAGDGDEKLLNEIIFVAALKAYQEHGPLQFNHVGKSNLYSD